MEYVNEIINFLVKNNIFLRLEIRWNRFNSSITFKFLQEQIVRYKPSKEHKEKCQDDVCHMNAKLEFIDRFGCVTNFKSFKDHRTITIFCYHCFSSFKIVLPRFFKSFTDKATKNSNRFLC